MNEATLLMAGSRPVLRFERHLPGSVELVWQAGTDPEEMRAWFPTRIEIDEWKVGATLSCTTSTNWTSNRCEPYPGFERVVEEAQRLSRGLDWA